MRRTRSPCCARIAADAPAEIRQSLCERCDTRRRFRIIRGEVHEHADAPHPLRLLRARRERPRDYRAADHRDELATFHLTEGRHEDQSGGNGTVLLGLLLGQYS